MPQPVVSSRYRFLRSSTECRLVSDARLSGDVDQTDSHLVLRPGCSHEHKRKNQTPPHRQNNPQEFPTKTRRKLAEFHDGELTQTETEGAGPEFGSRCNAGSAWDYIFPDGKLVGEVRTAFRRRYRKRAQARKFMPRCPGASSHLPHPIALADPFDRLKAGTTYLSYPPAILSAREGS